MPNIGVNVFVASFWESRSERHVGRIGKDRANLTANVPVSLIREIDARAAAVNLNRSAYTALILKRWKEEGCPPVTEADRALQLLKGMVKKN